MYLYKHMELQHVFHATIYLYTICNKISDLCTIHTQLHSCWRDLYWIWFGWNGGFDGHMFDLNWNFKIHVHKIFWDGYIPCTCGFFYLRFGRGPWNACRNNLHSTLANIPHVHKNVCLGWEIYGTDASMLKYSWEFFIYWLTKNWFGKILTPILAMAQFSWRE